MKTVIIFYNSNGNKKLALILNDRQLLSNMTEKTSKFINVVCGRNNYTFSCVNLTDEEQSKKLKNIPIIGINDIN